MQKRLAPYPELGPNAALKGFRPFPNTDPWNTTIDGAPVDPSSSRLLQAVLSRNPRAHLHPDFSTGIVGIPYIVVGQGTARAALSSVEYADESDSGAYPIPKDAPIEGGPRSDGDRHVLVIDRDGGKLYELFRAFPDGRGGWKAGSAAIFDLHTNTQRPAFWTSADAAGLPIFPGLARYDEVAQGEIRHALRFTLQTTRQAFVPPATHFASRSKEPTLAPMGMRVRLKKSVSLAGLAPQALVLARCFQNYGLILADNGGDFFVSGAPSPKWDDDQLNQLKRFTPLDFEVIKLGKLTEG